MTTCPVCGSRMVDEQEILDFFCTNDNAVEYTCVSCDFSWLADLDVRPKEDQ